MIEVTPCTLERYGIYCIKDQRSSGYVAKAEWFMSEINKGVKIKIAVDDTGKQIGFIEFLPSELAWRPVSAANYYFIQCIGLFVKEAKKKGTGSSLIRQCEEEAIKEGKSGICTVTSDGPWMANRSLFEKNGYHIAGKKDRFELMVKIIDPGAPVPIFNDWTREQEKYAGWHLIYSDQCPWHEKSVKDLSSCATEKGINLVVTRLKTPAEAQKAPSGFGTFSLLKDGKLLSDHYISRTRFENILKKII